MKRREFLHNLNRWMALAMSQSLPGLSIIPSIVKAQTSSTPSPEPKCFFVTIKVPNGWDVTLSLDPKIHQDGSDQQDIFLEYRPEDIFVSNTLKLGPACSPIYSYSSELVVINGIFMSDSNVSHVANLDYITTGNNMGLAADLAVELAYASHAGPFGVVFDTNLKRSARDIMPTSLSNLESLRKTIDIDRFDSFLKHSDNNSLFNKAQTSFRETNPIRIGFVKALDSMQSELEKANKPGDSSSNYLKYPALIAAAFASRTSFQAQLQFDFSLDTHSDHESKHLSEQKKAWEVIANAFRIFKSIPFLDSTGHADGSLFDHTCFAVVSEFSRSPALNASKGKDHNPLTNSVLLAGAGIKGGLSWGQSKVVKRQNARTGESRHVASPIDFKTGAIPQNKIQAQSNQFDFIYPENIAATIAEIVGVNREKFSSVDPETPIIKNILKS